MSDAVIPGDTAVAALDHIYRQVHVPAFFQKLAAYGIVPTDEREASYLCQMGDLALQELGQDRQKQASVQTTVVQSLADDLGLAADPATDYAKQAADHFAAQPDVADAARAMAYYLRS